MAIALIFVFSIKPCFEIGYDGVNVVRLWLAMQSPIEQIKPIKKLLDHYYASLIQAITVYGYAPEFLNKPKEKPFSQTRALSQTRSIFFLLCYHRLFGVKDAKKAAYLLYQKLKNDYYHHGAKDWCKYPNDAPMDDLYEYAFLLFSFSHLYNDYKEKVILDDITEIAELIKAKYLEVDFISLKDEKGVICQNAMMHLFEAYLSAYEYTKESHYKLHAEQLLANIIRRFYDEEKLLIKEYDSTCENALYEPGHSFEWCSLILDAKRLGLNTNIELEHNKTLTIDEKSIVQSAEHLGVLENGLVKPEIQSGSNDTYRIWPILEQIRYYALAKDAHKKDAAAAVFIKNYIENNNPVEYVNYQGISDFDKVKSTTGYHLINTFQHFFRG